MDKPLTLYGSESTAKGYQVVGSGLRMGSTFPYSTGVNPLSEVLEITGPPRSQTTKRLDKPPGTMNCRRPLRTLKDILSEQSRVYRAMINGVISTAEGTRLVFVLKEIRCTREAVDAAEAAAKAASEAAAIAAAAQAQANAEATPMAITIMTIPEGYYQQPDGSFAPMTPDMQLRLAPPAEAPPEPQSQSEAQLLVELDGLSDAQLLERAVQCGLDPNLLSSSPRTNDD